MSVPAEFQEALIEEATYLRGRILTSYAQVEFLLADISVKLNLRFPYLIKDRIKAAKRIADREGYEAFRDDLNRVCDELLQFDELRNFMAHGFVMLTTDRQQNHRFEFRLYQREEQGKFNLVSIETTVEQMHDASSTISEYVTDALSVFSRIYLEKRLERPDHGLLIEPKES